MSHLRPARPAVGNDVVDTTHPRCRGKSRDDRFIRRVLAPAEAAAVRAAADADHALWLRWAAKEAAFKAATAVRGEPPVFEHAAFVVEVEGEEGESARGTPGARGTVRWRELVLPWEVRDAAAAAGGIHVVSWPAEAAGSLELHGGVEPLADEHRIPLDSLSRREREDVHSPASAWVRLCARTRLADLTGASEGDVEIVTGDGPAGRSPPAVLLRGEPAEWSVSLSHHGGLVAWALARWRPGGAETPAEAPEAPGQSPGGR